MTATPREEKHQATRQRLERNAVSLVLEHGFDRVTVDMICEASGISQRTFFNYFKTKEAAVVGAEPPKIDEGKARAFIAADGPDLLAEVLELVAACSMTGGSDEKLLTDRLRLFETDPRLLLKQMDRMNRITADVGDLIYLRRRREAGPDGDEAELRDQADLLTHAILGVLRYTAMRWIRNEGKDQAETLASTSQLLRRTLRTL
ncbi:TetR family transcriptional regulator [Cryobacterium psychrophilum]|uniref:TetR family transcriptional regulator n=1 Tax=Cryobacterium psychrophilum TaxID=41988 RepID=A0A4Y8KN33_9MICO|nr:TetR family transcriptional regulator [Cryobacterium psychrophilum]TDW31176.1 TetR family transcriptional regulator [Cryobacterium psychrophilum]TFD78531.1 TetR family transcriptional regulator [Cryobacterium psychrophilum]